MGRMLYGSLLFAGGCLFNPSVEVDKQSVDMPRGTSSELTVSLDGTPLESLEDVVWLVDNPELVTVAPTWDGRHLRIGGDLEGHTMVHVNTHGQTIDIYAHVSPPAIVKMWIEPDFVATSLGDQGEVQVKAMAVDTLFHVVDVTRESRWTVRDPSVASLDMAGMMLHAEGLGQTTLHAVNGSASTMVPIEILK